MPNLKIEDLNKLYTDGESVDKEVFSEQRSNILLIAGEHYNKRQQRLNHRLRESKELTNEQKLRITKNHTQKIIRSYVNAITTFSPGVGISPRNEKELSDVKSAELNSSVWEWRKYKQRYKQKVLDWAEDYVGIGEVAVKVFWDPYSGDHIGYEAEMEEDEFGFSAPKKDENGELIKSKKAVFSGDLVWERIFGFNLIRPIEAKSMQEAKWLCIRKMVDIDDLKMKVGNDEEKLKFIESSADETYLVFEASKGGYAQSEKQVLLKEYYFRPCMEYPLGYYFITTNSGILWQGELPFGKFPIVYTGWNAIQTTPRHHSHVKHLRPFQVEANRAASKIAEHQVVLGDDKILVMNGTKISQGAQVPGIRSLTYSGAAPIILPGRAGDQYLPYASANISEMYQVSNVEEDKESKEGQVDPYSMLFKSLKQKKYFSIYTDKFENFLKEVCALSLELDKEYLTNQALIPIIGKAERVNIEEFKNTEPLSYQIKLDAQTEDMESKLGKQLTLTQLIQYVGPQLDKETLGKIIRNMPYGANEQMIDDLTMNYDISTNLILSLDRGKVLPMSAYADHVYIIRRLSHRMSQSDFQFLPPQVQQLYAQEIQKHEMAEAEKQRQIQAAKADYIPTTGYLVACDFYTSDPKNPDKIPKRVRVPSDSLGWLLERIQDQGTNLEPLGQLPSGAQAEIAGMTNTQPQDMQPGPEAYQAPNDLAGSGGYYQ